MEKAAPKLSGDGWAHKYWFLINPDRLDDYHSPRYQRFHLFKLLQMSPDRVGILDGVALPNGRCEVLSKRVIFCALRFLPEACATRTGVDFL